MSKETSAYSPLEAWLQQVLPDVQMHYQSFAAELTALVRQRAADSANYAKTIEAL